MSRQRLPLIGSSGGKSTKATSLPTAQRPLRSKPLKRAQPQSSLLVSDSYMAPWGGLDLSESSFTSLSPPRPPTAPPPPPPAPHATPASPHRTKNQTRNLSTSTAASDMSTPSPAPAAHDTAKGQHHQLRRTLSMDSIKVTAGGAGRTFRSKRRPLPPRRAPRPPRLPPLRQVTSLSFSRSFTFSFFELPLYQSPRCRAERTKNLLLLIKQVHY